MPATQNHLSATPQPAPAGTKPTSSAPMCSAAMIYNSDGSVAWEQMWDTFCELASAGGPPHRGQMLFAPDTEDGNSPQYQQVCNELIRGIALVSGLKATQAKPGWLAVKCGSAAQARWMSEEIMQENVAARAEGDLLYLPVAANFSLSGEIKNVITVVAKTSHYWQDHMSGEMKTLMAWEARISGALRGWRNAKKERSPARNAALQPTDKD